VKAPRSSRDLFLTWLLVCALLLLSTQNASAHIVNGEGGGFGSGFQHPWSGWDHILAMVAVGIWGAQLGAPAIWVLPVTFPLVMSVGGFLGLMGLPASFQMDGTQIHADEIGIALSMLGLGALVLREARPPIWVAAAVVGLFGLCHGYAHGKELPEGESGLLYSIGFVVATGSLHCVGITLGLIHRWPAGKTALRFAGVIIFLGGVYFLWNDLAHPEAPEKPRAKSAQISPPAQLFFHG